jgi:hypothetical protein
MEESLHSIPPHAVSGLGATVRHYDGAAMVVGVFAASVMSVETIVDLFMWLQYSTDME